MPRLSALAGTISAGVIFAAGCEEPPPPPPIEPAAAAVTKAVLPQVAESTALPAWRFITVKGEVTQNGEPATEKAAIAKTDTIETGADGYATITLGPGSLIEIRAKTKITLGASQRKKVSAQIFLGQVWSLFDRPTEFEVVTPNAVAGVRGTVFFTEASNKKKTIFCACSHTVELQSLKNKKPFNKAVAAKEWEHIAYQFTRRGKKIVAKSLGSMPSPPSHADEQGKRLLAAIPH